MVHLRLTWFENNRNRYKRVFLYRRMYLHITYMVLLNCGVHERFQPRFTTLRHYPRSHFPTQNKYASRDFATYWMTDADWISSVTSTKVLRVEQICSISISGTSALSLTHNVIDLYTLYVLYFCLILDTVHDQKGDGKDYILSVRARDVYETIGKRRKTYRKSRITYMLYYRHNGTLLSW